MDTFHAVLSFSDYSDKNYKIFMKLLTSINIVIFTAGKKHLLILLKLWNYRCLDSFECFILVAVFYHSLRVRSCNSCCSSVILTWYPQLQTIWLLVERKTFRFLETVILCKKFSWISHNHNHTCSQYHYQPFNA